VKHQHHTVPAEKGKNIPCVQDSINSAEIKKRAKKGKYLMMLSQGRGGCVLKRGAA
jgi:hypothetical protein